MELYKQVKDREPKQTKEFQTTACHKEFGVMTVWWVPDVKVWEDADEYQWGPKEIEWWIEEVDVTKIIEEIEDLHPYKQSGDRDSYSDYSQGWADACDVILSRLKGDG